LPVKIMGMRLRRRRGMERGPVDRPFFRTGKSQSDINNSLIEYETVLLAEEHKDRGNENVNNINLLDNNFAWYNICT
jgi:hypothetical protein